MAGTTILMQDICSSTLRPVVLPSVARLLR
jgi:hypothetical protein